MISTWAPIMQINDAHEYIIGDNVDIIDDVACTPQQITLQIATNVAILIATPSKSSRKTLSTLPVKPNWSWVTKMIQIKLWCSKWKLTKVQYPLEIFTHRTRDKLICYSFLKCIGKPFKKGEFKMKTSYLKCIDNLLQSTWSTQVEKLLI